MEKYRERVNRIYDYYQQNKMPYEAKAFLHELKNSDLKDMTVVGNIVRHHEILQMGCVLEEDDIEHRRSLI